MLDLRVPSGWFFAILGAILVGMGAFAPDTRAALTDANVNLYAGLVMFAFGVFLLLIARAASSRSHS
jgi:predicted phage tail protein